MYDCSMYHKLTGEPMGCYLSLSTSGIFMDYVLDYVMNYMGIGPVLLVKYVENILAVISISKFLE